MKMKRFARYRHDKLRCELEGLGLPLRDDEYLDGFRQIMEKHAGELMPTLVSRGGKGRRKRKYSLANFQRAVDEAKADEPPAWISFGHPAIPMTEGSIDFYERVKRFSISLDVLPLAHFQQPGHAEDRCHQFVELVRGWASWYPISYGWAHSLADHLLMYLPNYESRDLYTEKVEEVYWLNILGKDIVDGIGRDRVLSTPAHLVEELPFGSVLLLTRPTLADCLSEEGRLAQARALVHLRPDLSFDAVMAGLRAQSVTLTPQEPHFDPQIADLLERMVDTLEYHRRLPAIARYNSNPPPEVAEWLPRSALLPSDVPDTAATLRDYRNNLCEQLAALLHTEVPSVMGGKPESLSDIDYFLWYDHWPERFAGERIDNILVPAVGAYLGEVLVHHLGGTWIPRRKLSESQVLLGDRAWLPFARAERYLRSRDSLVDYSLTQFFRTAERHVRSLGQP